MPTTAPVARLLRARSRHDSDGLLKGPSGDAPCRCRSAGGSKSASGAQAEDLEVVVLRGNRFDAELLPVAGQQIRRRRVVPML